MSEQEYKVFLKELVQDLERYLIQSSSMTHVIFSLKEMQALIKIEEYWLHKILVSQLTVDDLVELEEIGQQLNQIYNLSLSDVIDLIDTAQNYCLTSLPHSSLPIPSEKIIAAATQVKQHLGYGFFKSAVDEFVNRFEENGFMDTPAMKLHKNWLKKLRVFLQDIHHNEAPVMEHNLCAFSKWLETLEAKMILHASKDHRFDMQGNILLTHRAVHEEASYVHIHLSQQHYLKALSHFDNFCQAFLLLDKYINEANFIYQKNRYFNFIDFVMAEGKHQRSLSYYFVIHYGLIEQAEIRGKQKKIILESFTDLFLKKLAENNIEHISLLQKNRLHVVIKQNQHALNGKTDANILIDEALDEVYNHFSRILSERLYINHFKLSNLTNYETKHFNALLQKIQKDKQNQHIREVNENQIQRYQISVEQDFILLETIKQHLKEQTFDLHYQPIVDYDGKIMALESLIRFIPRHR